MNEDGDVVEPKDVIASMNDGSDSTENPMTLGNVASNLAPTTSTTTLIGQDGSTSPVAEPTKSAAAPSQDDAIAMNNNAATVGDVLNAGWNLQGNGDAVDFVKPYDTVNFVDGQGTTAEVTSDGLVSNVTYNVNVDNETTQITAKDKDGNKVIQQPDGSWKNEAGDVVDAGDVTGPQTVSAVMPVIPEVETTPLTTSNDGKVNKPAAPDDKKLATAGDIADAINNSGWNVTSAAIGSGEVSGTSKELVNPGETVTLVAGDNMVLEQDGNKFTYSVNANPTFESVQLGDENGPKITNEGDNIKVGDKDGNPTNITNVKGHLADAGDATEMPADSAPDKWTENKNDAATLGDVLNAGWNLQGNGDAVDFVTHGDTVNFVDGKLTKVSVENKDGVNNVKVDVNLKGGKDIEITKDGVINYTGADNDTIITLTANNGEKANETKGNITLTQNGDNYDVSLNKDITLDKGSITIDKGGKPENNIVISGDNVSMGGNQIHNVAAGTEPNDAVNVSQLKDIVGDVARNEVKQGDTIGGTTIDGDYNIVTSKDDPQATLKTYNVHTQTEFVTNDVVQAISKMNEQGIKFFHTNDGTQEPEAQAHNTVDASAKGKFSTAIGYQAKADGESALAIGNGSAATAANSIAIGAGNTVTGEKSIAIGFGHTVSGSHSGAFGDPDKIEGDDSYAVGNNVEIAKGNNKVFVLGNNVKETHSNSVFLGDSSAYTKAGASTAGMDEYSTNAEDIMTTDGKQVAVAAGDLNFAGAKPAGVVSVGAEGAERRIQNVAAGLISEKSTDAINGSQLYSVAQQVGKVSNGGAGPVQYSNANSPTTPNGGVPSNDVTIVGANQDAPVTVHNVAPGVEDTDAVNVSQLKQAMGNNKNWEPRINQVENRANAGVAQAMATAGLPQAYLPGKSMFAAGTGVYRGEMGYAVGVSSISDGGNWIVKGTASGNSRGNFGATAAIGYQW